MKRMAMHTVIVLAACLPADVAVAQERTITRAELIEKTSGFWIGQLVGNYMGFPFESVYIEEPIPVLVDRYYTPLDADADQVRMNRDDHRAWAPILFTYFGFPAIFDLLSRNRTVVNDVPVSFKLLKNDDELTIGESRFRVRLVGSAVSEQVVRQLGAAGKPQRPTLEAPAPDLIDIKATEGSQRWRVAENLEKANRKR